MEVTLTTHEMAIAAWVGVRRNVESRRRGLRDRHGYKGDGWQVHIEGAGGELAVAKALDMYWDGSVNTFKRADLPGIQVRTALTHKNLIVRPADAPDEVFVLVTGQMPDYQVHGRLRGSDAMQPQFLSGVGGRPPAYFVPPSKLNPIETLPRSSQEAA